MANREGSRALLTSASGDVLHPFILGGHKAASSTGHVESRQIAAAG